jgi:hypothetical protein
VIKKIVATAAIAVSAVGASAAVAPQALAIGNDNGPSLANGNGAWENYGNATTYGMMSPQIALIQGSFNKPCIAVSHVPVQVPVLGAGLQDIPILSDELNQQCTQNSTQSKRDGALAHLLENVSLLSTEAEHH